MRWVGRREEVVGSLDMVLVECLAAVVRPEHCVASNLVVLRLLIILLHATGCSLSEPHTQKLKLKLMKPGVSHGLIF